MLVIRDNSAADFLREASELLYRHEAMNNLTLGLAESLASGRITEKSPALLVRVVDQGKTVLAGAQVNHVNLTLSVGEPQAVGPLVDFLASIETSFSATVGEAEIAQRFAQAWAKKTKCTLRLQMDQKIYRLDEVFWPKGHAPGRGRLARPEERDQIADWMEKFILEAVPADAQPLSLYQEQAEKKISAEEIFVWEDESGELASMAFVGRPTRSGIGVNCVYTPKQKRGRGYASWVVAFASQTVLDRGHKFAVLYTDLANPTSNKIYQALGYREVGRSNHFVFLT